MSERVPSGCKPVEPYSVLASVYDLVMEHVDYEAWARHVHDLIARFHPDANSIFELGCGTGSLAFELLLLHTYRYVATDRSEAMLRVAREKADLFGADVNFAVADFTTFSVDARADVVLLLYDGVNYLLSADEIELLMDRVYRSVCPGGLFIFDQSTPANSINNADFFEDRGGDDAASYVRRSRFDADAALHHTDFEITIDGQSFSERHVQRAYSLGEVAAIVESSEFRLISAFEDLTDLPAGENSERVHWVLRRP